jgi:hypothetical protein
MEPIEDIGAGVLKGACGDGAIVFWGRVGRGAGLSAEEGITFGEECGEEAGASGGAELSGFEEESGDTG